MIASSTEKPRVAAVVQEGAGYSPASPGDAVGTSNIGYLNLFAEQSDDLLWVRDLTSGRILYVSEAYERKWGRSRRDLSADLLDWRRMIEPEDLPAVEKAFDALFRAGPRSRSPIGSGTARDGASSTNGPGRSPTIAGPSRWRSGWCGMLPGTRKSKPSRSCSCAR